MIRWIFLLLLISCSSVSQNKNLLEGEFQYTYEDVSGTFTQEQKNLIKDQKKYYSKHQLFEQMSQERPLEKTIAVSDIGYLNVKGQKFGTLRPDVSQFTVWIDKKKYFSQIRLRAKERSFEVFSESPEKKWNLKKMIKAPRIRGPFCFFTQLLQCIKASGFIDKAVDEKAGQMNLVIVWENYPYASEQFKGHSGKLFSRARVDYEGLTRERLYKIGVFVERQTIAFHLNKKLELMKMFWIAQGLSKTRTGL